MGRSLRSFAVRLVVAAALAGAVGGAGLAAPARAADQEIVLDKVVNGTAPSGATYQVELQCQPTGVISGGFVFSGPGTQTVDATGITSCTVSEPGAGGASSVAFRCQATGRGQCVSETELQFLPGDGLGSVTITITNTFTPPPTSPTTASTTTTSSTTTSTSTTTTSTSTTTSSTTTTSAPATTRPGSTPGTAVSTATDEGASNLTPAIVVAVIAGLGVIGLVAALLVQRRRQAEAAHAETEGEAYLPGGGDRPDAGPYGPTEPPVDPPAKS